MLFYLRDSDNLSTRDNIVAPKVSLVQRYHCSCLLLQEEKAEKEKEVLQQQLNKRETDLNQQLKEKVNTSIVRA